MAVIAREEVPARFAAAWEEVLAICERVLAADLLLFAVPMWNGGIPWALKLFVDIVTQPGIAFRFDPETGYHGLLGGRQAVAVYTSRVFAPGVGPEFGVDNQSRYLTWWLEYCGIQLVEEIRFQPTFPTPDLELREAAARADAERAAIALATLEQPASP
jgi:FMN-dependent NADH-azoreductase